MVVRNAGQIVPTHESCRVVPKNVAAGQIVPAVRGQDALRFHPLLPIRFYKLVKILRFFERRCFVNAFVLERDLAHTPQRHHGYENKNDGFHHNSWTGDRPDRLRQHGALV